ncbi:MAG: hypothetical protein NT080_01650 [Spirochaetes bacterium]|nr:hypothetical protein [Spirochaetota bacterium]
MKTSTLVAVVSVSAAIVALSAAVIAWIVRPKVPSAETVRRELVAYVSSLSPAGSLGLVEGRERLVIRDTIKGQLFGATKLGEFLRIRSDAVIEVEAWADTFYGVSLAAELWSVAWDPRTRSLAVHAPTLEARVPAVLTDTITVRILDRSILVNEAKVAESMKSALTKRFTEYVGERAAAPDVTAKADAALAGIVRNFADKLGSGAGSVSASVGGGR